MEQMKEQSFVFRLIDSALMGKSWNQIPENLDWHYICNLCSYHKIDNLISYAIGYADRTIRDKIPKQVQKFLYSAQQKGLAREATQYFSLEELQQKFEENKIDNIPLKGAQLKSYYPSPDMRFLTDLDILCHNEDAESIAQIMKELGYTLEHGGGHHDVYVREPFMTVEIHWICSTENKEMNNLFEDIWDRCQKWDGFEHSYRMPWEDYYVYMIGHMVKHLKYGGIGIRMLLDLYIFEEKLKGSCDWKYVETNLENAGVLRFAQTMSQFLQRCLKGEATLQEDYILMEHIIENGAHGTIENYNGVRFLKDGGNKVSILKNKILLIVRILFPTLESMKQLCSYVGRYPILLPVAWIDRLIKKTLFENKKSRKILKDATDTQYLQNMDKVCRAAGLY